VNLYSINGFTLFCLKKKVNFAANDEFSKTSAAIYCCNLYTV